MNTTTGPQHSQFVSLPDTRSTWDILWSSLFTIVACTWTVQHLNVPEQRESCKPGWRGTFRWNARKVFRKAKWMLITIIAPEIVIGMAFQNRLAAKAILRDLSELALEDGVPWTLTHSYFANMGGFVLRSKSPEAIEMLPKTSLEDGRLLRVSDGADQRPDIAADDSEANTDHPTGVADSTQHVPYNNSYHLIGSDIFELRKTGVIPKLPNISQAELEDRSKSDPFVKSITLAQIIWATLQVIVRSARRLAISQLELAVIAFAGCAIVLYILYWPKPKDVSATTTIIEFDGSIPSSVFEAIKQRSIAIENFLTGSERQILRHGNPIRNDAMDDSVDDGNNFNAFLLAVMLGSMVFGGIHVVAWNFEFPTRIELVLWRCASLYVAFCGIFLFLFIGIVLGLMDFDASTFIYGLFFQVPYFIYVLARLALLVEIFRTLFFLPPDAYVSTWTQFIPHFS